MCPLTSSIVCTCDSFPKRKFLEREPRVAAVVHGATLFFPPCTTLFFFKDVWYTVELPASRFRKCAPCHLHASTIQGSLIFPGVDRR